MKTFKKLALGLGTVAAITAPVASVVACGTESTDIGATVYNQADPFIKLLSDAMVKQAGAVKLSIKVADSANSQSTQNDQVDAQIADGVKMLAINLVDPAVATSIIAKAKAAGLPIVLYNKEGSKDAMATYDKVWYVGAAAKESGEMQAVLIQKDMEIGAIKDRNKDGKIGYFVIGGEAGHADAMARTTWVRKNLIKLIMEKGVNDAGFSAAVQDPTHASSNAFYKMDANGRIYIQKGQTEAAIKSILADYTSSSNGTNTDENKAEWTDWSEAKGKVLATAKIQSIALGLDFIAANNDGTALGAVAAAKDANLEAFTENYADSASVGHLAIYGVDATNPAKEAIKAGFMDGTVLNDAENQGKAVINLIKNVLDGVAADKGLGHTLEPLTKAIRVPYVPVGRDVVNAENA